MADESTQLQVPTNSTGQIVEGQSQSLENTNKRIMDTIRNYRAIYDKSYPEYKNQRVKTNAWQAVATLLGMDVALVQKRYNTIWCLVA